MPVRASDRIKTMSPSLDEIAGAEVVVRTVEISDRPMRGSTQKFVEVGITRPDQKTGEIEKYHAWSPSLAEKLEQLTDADLSEGVIGTFTKVRTGSGFQVWNFA